MHRVARRRSIVGPNEVRFFHLMGSEPPRRVEIPLPETHSEGILGEIDDGGVQFEPEPPEPPADPDPDIDPPSKPPKVDEPKHPDPPPTIPPKEPKG
jgi:hypothetical protein